MVKKNKEKVIALDKLTYAGNLDNFKISKTAHFFVFFMVILAIVTLLDITSKKYQPRSIINFAAESHVDRSIHGPDDFIQTILLLIIY